MDQSSIIGNIISAITPDDGKSSSTTTDNTRSDGGKRVVGYFTNWETKDYPPSMIPVDDLTHLNYAFAKINKETGEVTLSDPHTDTEVHFHGAISPQGSAKDIAPGQSGNNLFGCLGALYLMKKHNRNLKVLLSIGGATFSFAFENIEYIHWRNTFVQSTVKLVEDCGLDGIDLGYQYPTEKTGTYYSQLVKQLRIDLNNVAERNHQPKDQYLISLAAPCGEDKMRCMPIKDLNVNVNFWNLMAYDFSGPWSSVTDHQANLFGTDDHDLSIDKAFKFYRNEGVPAEKLVMGMPLYGRLFSNTNGIGKAFHGTSTIEYRNLPPAGAEVHNDEHLGASYSFDKARQELVSYDTPENADMKTGYINKHNFGGAMFWQLAGDKHRDSKSLVKIVRNRLGRIEKRDNELKYPNSKYDNLKGGMSGQ